jgi:hypothetical protein
VRPARPERTVVPGGPEGVRRLGTHAGRIASGVSMFFPAPVSERLQLVRCIHTRRGFPFSSERGCRVDLWLEPTLFQGQQVWHNGSLFRAVKYHGERVTRATKKGLVPGRRRLQGVRHGSRDGI